MVQLELQPQVQELAGGATGGAAGATGALTYDVNGRQKETALNPANSRVLRGRVSLCMNLRTTTLQVTGLKLKAIDLRKLVISNYHDAPVRVNHPDLWIWKPILCVKQP